MAYSLRIKLLQSQTLRKDHDNTYVLSCASIDPSSMSGEFRGAKPTKLDRRQKRGQTHVAGFIITPTDVGRQCTVTYTIVIRPVCRTLPAAPATCLLHATVSWLWRSEPISLSRVHRASFSVVDILAPPW